MRGLHKSKLWSMQTKGKRCLLRVVKSGFEICHKYRHLEAEMEPCNRSSGRSETKYESCEKQCCKILKKKKTHLTSYSLSALTSALRIKREPSIPFVIANYREMIVVFAESELWLTLCVDWLLSIFYCYLLTFGKLTR